MENFRVFERKCLRACLGAYRSTASEYRKFVSNAALYDMADIPTIDSHIIRLIRDYFSKIPQINNEAIKSLTCFTADDFRQRNETGQLPLQAILAKDNNDIIQDEDNVPVIYHWKRHKAEKRIEFTADDLGIKWFDFTYSKSSPQSDKMDAHRLSDKYSWLTSESRHCKELKRRLQPP